ncbi:MAG TPA: dockerin type I domain-containing protein [Pirellula sp.]|nr:dockerin type I domain-containing protein [Pirellula sp.]
MNRSCRRLTLEKLEFRSLMTGIPGFHNTSLPLDVDNDFEVTPLDALVVINQINRSKNLVAEEFMTEEAVDQAITFCDVDADGSVSDKDILAVVEQLNADASLPLDGNESTESGESQSNGVLSVSAIPEPVISGAEVNTLLQRAAMATSSNDAIIAVVDRSGRILGVRTESDVDATFAGRTVDRVFAIDGAVAKARTAAFFSNNAAPLTSRTIRFISQSTITQREVVSNPDITDLNSPLRGPGFVAPIGTGAHFPPVVANTPPVDLFAIEHQSRDSSVHAGFDGLKGNADDKTLAWRFDANPAFIPDAAKMFLQTFPESYGVQSGLLPNAQGRGIATLPGGMPLYKSGVLVGGIGVFFPGPNGYASYEQNFVHTSLRGAAGPQSNSDRLNAPKVLESEFIAYFAAGGTVVGPGATPVTQFEGLAPSRGSFGMPIGRIDLVGITLEIFGPHPTRENAVTGTQRLLQVGRANQGGRGSNSGTNQRINPANATSQSGQSVPEGWLVMSHASSVDPQFTAPEVEQIINNGRKEADLTRAAIRLDSSFRPGARAKMVLSVADSAGEVLGLYRMPDATIFSVDVAVAKSRNTAYYAGNSLVAADRIDQDNNGSFDIPAGTALTNRTFRFLALPRFPSGAPEGTPPGDFSSLTMPGINPLTGENSNPNVALPASVYASNTATVLSFDSFNASRNFRDPRNIRKQNGIVFFPGSSALYDDVSGAKKLVGGLGVSGDGVDQDDVVTVGAQQGFQAPDALRADQFIVAGVRLPYQNFNRNPRG